MKNKILSFALCLCLLIGLFAGTLVPAYAESNSDDWNWILSGNDVVLVGYRGTETDLIIPSVIEGHRVTTLQESLLKGKCDITSVTIPASVTLIQHFAFRDCGNLTAVYYEGTLGQWCNISFEESYSNPLTCAHHLYIQGEKFTQFTLPDNITSIKKFVFSGCKDFSEVTIPEGVTEIGEGAFLNCAGLVSVTLPVSLTSVKSNAFAECEGLKGRIL